MRGLGAVHPALAGLQHREHRAERAHHGDRGLERRVINETRFQFMNSNSVETGNNSLPSINVLQSFSGGGSQVGRSYDRQEALRASELSRLGRRDSIRSKPDSAFVLYQDDNYSAQNFGGSFQFASGVGPHVGRQQQPVPGCNTATGVTTTCVQLQSIQVYQRTLLFQTLGYTPAQIRASGGGASQFSIAAGNSLHGSEPDRYRCLCAG